MASSKIFVLLGLVLAIALLVSSEVSARDLAEQTQESTEGYYGGGRYGKGGGYGKGRGYGKGGGYGKGHGGHGGHGGHPAEGAAETTVEADGN